MTLHQEKLDEMRQDMLIEIKMRNDDDYFYDYIVDRYQQEIKDFVWCCRMYDRGEEVDDWFQVLIEK